MRDKVIRFLQKEIDLQHIPGAVVSVSFQHEILFQEALGYRTVFPSKEKMELSTIFDIASLTKVVATLPVILKLIEAGIIRLDDRIASFFPHFSQNGKESITIRHLLTHTSGLPAHRQFYKDHLSKEEIYQQIEAEKLETSPNTKVIYSDLGLITLYRLVEKITGESFERLVKREILDPLEMNETMFNPTFDTRFFATTEFNEQKNGYKHGVVHDENAETMGGVSGHAGLFSTIKDLSNFASMIENEGTYKGKKILSEAALQLSKQNFTSFDQEFRGLGWQLKSLTGSPCGDLFSPTSYGHTGFTGTSIWFDPEIKLHVILLTNRVHFGRQNHILSIRPKLHNLIKASL